MINYYLGNIKVRSSEHEYHYAVVSHLSDTGMFELSQLIGTLTNLGKTVSSGLVDMHTHRNTVVSCHASYANALRSMRKHVARNHNPHMSFTIEILEVR